MIFPVFLGKIVSLLIKLLNLGAGATWPGEIALRIDPDILSKITPKNIILVAGTNGKTTTAFMIKTILEKDGQSVVHNSSGANLLNGIVSAIITSPPGEWGVFEVDENSLPGVLANLSSRDRSDGEAISIKQKIASSKTPRNDNKQKVVVVLLNLFRDQLDRYGEVDVIAEKWERALRRPSQAQDSSGRADRFSLAKTRDRSRLGPSIQVIANADDPQIAEIARPLSLRDHSHGEAISNQVRDRHSASWRIAMTKRVIFFGLDDPAQFVEKLEHATDSTFCPRCGTRLTYKGVYYSHIGDWRCARCKNIRPKPDISTWEYPLPGFYNRYNTLATVATAKSLGIADQKIKHALRGFSPAFGRQEEFEIDGRKVKIFLSKNPAGFNESLRTVLQLGAKNILFVLNDRIPDGRDVSWIWDVDFEMIAEKTIMVISGDRCWDMGLRIKYSNPSKFQISNFKFQIEEDLKKAINRCLRQTPKSETLYILPTYSAMLEVRKLLTGRRIL